MNHYLNGMTLFTLKRISIPDIWKLTWTIVTRACLNQRMQLQSSYGHIERKTLVVNVPSLPL